MVCHILGFLDAKDKLGKQIRQVNRLFFECVHKPAAWRTVAPWDTGLKVAVLRRIAPHQLKYIESFECPDVRERVGEDDMEFIFNSCKRLKYISLGPYVEWKGGKSLKALCGHQLQSLHLTPCKDSVFAPGVLQEVLLQLPNLQSFHFRPYVSVLDPTWDPRQFSVDDAVAAFQHLPHLRDFAPCIYTCAEWCDILLHLPKSVKSLSIEIRPSMAPDYQDEIKATEMVRLLADRGGFLEELYLGCVPFVSDTDMDILLPALRNVRALTIGNIDYRLLPVHKSLTDRTLTKISECCPDLQSLVVTTQYKGFSDTGVISVMSKCHNLQELYFEGDHIETPIYVAMTISKHCHKMRHMFLSSVTKKVMDDIQNALVKMHASVALQQSA